MGIKNGRPCKRCGIFDYNKQGQCRRCLKVNNKKWRQKNGEKLAASNRKWRKANPKKVVAIKKRWQRNNPAKVAAYNKRWELANPKKAREMRNRWWRDNPESKTSANSNRRARKMEAGGSYTGGELRELYNYYGNRCLSCGRDDVSLEADHVIALANGGTNDIGNIQPLCKSCNTSKGAHHNTDYRKGTRLKMWIQKKLF